MRISSYPSIYALGHKAVAEILLDEVVVQEKVDGSQISFGLMPLADPLYNEDGSCTTHELHIRSKGAEIQVLAPEKMFARAVESIKAVSDRLFPGWTYRGEYLAKPKHNALAYDRVPKNHIVLFDVDRGDQDYLNPPSIAMEAERLGFEAVPTLWVGRIESAQDIRALLDYTSFLGGQKIEGVVIKNYARFGIDKKILMAKFVSEAYKEVHAAEWKTENPTGADIVERLIQMYRTPARWAKAIQHLREAGQIEDSPRDIGLLFKEVPADVEKEEADAIKDALYAYAWPRIRRGICAGLPEWYKDVLLSQQFEGDVRREEQR